MDDLSARLIDIEASIGITRAGRSVRFFPRSNFLLSASESPKNEGEVTPLFEQGGQMHRGNAKRLMARLNDVTTWTIFSKRSPEWDIECVDFLLGLLNKSERLRGDGRGGGSGGSEGIVPGHETVKGEAFVETLEWLREHSRACLEMAITTEARLHLQLNIVGSPSALIASFILFLASENDHGTDNHLSAIHVNSPRRRPNQRATSYICREGQHEHENHCNHHGCLSPRDFYCRKPPTPSCPILELLFTFSFSNSHFIIHSTPPRSLGSFPFPRHVSMLANKYISLRLIYL